MIGTFYERYNNPIIYVDDDSYVWYITKGCIGNDEGSWYRVTYYYYDLSTNNIDYRGQDTYNVGGGYDDDQYIMSEVCDKLEELGYKVYEDRNHRHKEIRDFDLSTPVTILK